MTVVVSDPRVPGNISHVSSRNPRAVQEAYESGELVILNDVRIAADFDFLSSINPPNQSQPHRQEFCLFRQEADRPPDPRSKIWEDFEVRSRAGNGLPTVSTRGDELQHSAERVDRAFVSSSLFSYSSNFLEVATSAR